MVQGKGRQIGFGIGRARPFMTGTFLPKTRSNIQDYTGGGFLRKHPVVYLSFCLMVLALVISGCTEALKKDPVAIEPSIEKDLKQVHPDEDVSYTFNTRFSLGNALDRVGLLKRMSLPPGEASMAFSNSIGAVEGTLLKQDYEIKKLDFELARILFRDGEITKEQLDQKEAAYSEAVSTFKAFWESFGISD
jgi:hypothetical protein